jgi:hypothetical protein
MLIVGSIIRIPKLRQGLAAYDLVTETCQFPLAVLTSLFKQPQPTHMRKPDRYTMPTMPCPVRVTRSARPDLSYDMIDFDDAIVVGQVSRDRKQLTIGEVRDPQ